MDKNRHIEIFKQLTVEEKLHLLDGANLWETNGVPRLNIHPVWMSDGPHGLRKEIKQSDGISMAGNVEAVCYPAACLSACSFDKKIGYLLGKSIASEARKNDVALILGPGINIKRHPLCGRNFEYFSEDPVLAGLLAKNYVLGAKSEGIGCCVKHFACNSQETNRFLYSSNLDLRTLNDLYLKAFYLANTSSRVDSVMGCYNQVNGDYGCQNDYLLNQALRNRFGFEGFVVSDWGACYNPVESFKNGLNLNMPGNNSYVRKTMLKAYRNNLISIDEIDKAVLPIFNFIMDYQNINHDDNFSLDVLLKNAKKIALESIVLAKNEFNILPLDKNEKIAFIGQFGKNMHIQGGGSSRIVGAKVTQPIEVLDEYGIKYDYADGYDIKTESTNETMINEAIEIAKANDKVILFLGLFDSQESEGFDRTNMRLASFMNELVDSVYEVNKNIVVVLEVGAPVELPFIDKVKAVVVPYLCGVQGGEALIDILYGNSSPCGRFAETWPIKLEDTYLKDKFPVRTKNIPYNEGVYVGYRYYQHTKQNVLFEFGFGLSYARFKYCGFQFDGKKISVDVYNDSDIGSKEVIQLYVKDSKNDFKQLKDFEKIEILPYSHQTVSFEINDEYFKSYSEKKDDYIVKKDVYHVYLATSSKNMLYDVELNIDGEEDNTLYPIDINIKEMIRIDNSKKGNYDLNTTLAEIKSSFLGRRLYDYVMHVFNKNFKGDEKTKEFMLSSMVDLPLRGLVAFGGASQGLTTEVMLSIIDVLNGHPIDGLKKLREAKKLN